MKIEIREATISDRKIYIEYAKEFYRSPAVLHDIPEKYILSTFDEFIAGNPFLSVYMIVEANSGDVAGYCQLSYTYSQEAGGMVCWIEEIYLNQVYRGQGLGRKCLVQILSKPGFKRFRLEATKTNCAIQIYEKLGFTKLDYQQFIIER